MPAAGVANWFSRVEGRLYRCRVCGANVRFGGSGVTDTRRRHVAFQHGVAMDLVEPPAKGVQQEVR